MNANKITLNDQVLIDLTQDTAVEEDVALGKTFCKADGTFTVGTAELSDGTEVNIAYGDTAPDDTSKLWVKCDGPSEVVVSGEVEEVEGSGGIETLSATMPQYMFTSKTLAIGSKIYLFGYSIVNYKYFGAIRYFDTESETSTTLSATIPDNREGAVVYLVGTTVYILGGSNRSNRTYSIYCFNVESQTITTLTATLPSPIAPDSTTAHSANGSRVYFMGTATSKAICCFDAESQITTTLPTTLPNHYAYSPFSSIGYKLYLFGYTASSSTLQSSPEILCFDTESETLSTLSETMPTLYYWAKASTLGTKIYLFGGTSKYQFDLSSYFDVIYCFDSETETITESTTKLPKAQALSAVQTVRNKIYLFSGRDTASFYEDKALNEIYCFTDGELALQNGTLQLIPSQDANIFPLISIDPLVVEIGVDKVYKGNSENIAEEVPAALYKDGAWVDI